MSAQPDTIANGGTETRIPAKILVVDDEPDLRLLIEQKFRRQIRNHEFAFIFAGNGLEALDLLKDNSDVEIVLTDINMPRMDGLSLLLEIKNLELTLRCVVVSAYGDLGNIRTAMNRGAFDFVTKPIDFNDLSHTISRTQEQVRLIRQATEVQSELENLRQELEIASKIQQSLLPGSDTHPSESPMFDIHARMKPAREVGGDFFDYFMIGKRKLGFLVGDVSGKGMASALFMVMSRTLLRAAGMTCDSAADCLTYANRMICMDNASSMFVTTFFGILDLDTGELEYCNGGHDAAFIMTDESFVCPLASATNIALGIEEDFVFRAGSINLSPGDAVFLYTDGISEAENTSQELYERERLLAELVKAAGKNPVEIVQAVVDSVSEHAGDAPQSDDITALAVRFLGGTGGVAN
jgi:sigma-B regulation protein RsbU (phosphoserine phosphatase)